MQDTDGVIEKVQQVIQELKLMQLCSQTLPDWTHSFNSYGQMQQENFATWLRYVYLPNLLCRELVGRKMQDCIVPQAVEHMGSFFQSGKLLQLLVELDSLS